jgi:hypothetical protein
MWIILSPFKSIYEVPKDFSSVSFSVEYRILTVGALRNELQHVQHVIVIINNKYFTIDETNFFVRLLLPMLLLLINFNSFVAILIAMNSFVSIEMNPIWIILPTPLIYKLPDKDTIKIEILPHLSVAKRGYICHSSLPEVVRCILYKLKTGCQWLYASSLIVLHSKGAHATASANNRVYRCSAAMFVATELLCLS